MQEQLKRQMSSMHSTASALAALHFIPPQTLIPFPCPNSTRMQPIHLKPSSALSGEQEQLFT